jgi:outer membrane protein assembly factor BamB
MIELDLSRPWDADDPLGFGEQRPTHGWRNPPPWLVPTLLAVFIMVGLGGAAAPPRRDPVFAQTTPQAGLAFDRDDTVYLYQQRARSGRLQAYQPDRKSPLWTVDYPNANPVPTLTTEPGLVLVSVYDADPTRPSENVIEVRESRTGRRLWQRSGVGMIDAAAGTVVVTDYRGWGGDDEATGPATVAALDIRTGTSRWSHTIDDAMLLAIDRAIPAGPHGDTLADADGLVELDQDGVLRILDPVTGAARATLRLPLSGPALYLMVQDGMAVVSVGRPGADPVGYNSTPASIVGYDLETGQVRWHADGPDVAGPCGSRYLCTYDPQALIVKDWTTGDVRYRGQSDRVSFRGDLLLVSRSVPGIGSTASGSELWSLTTGRKVRSFGPWHLVTDDPRDGDLVGQTGAGGVLMVAMLDLETGAARVIGRAGDWIGDASCTFGRRYLGCIGPGGVRIWRKPDGIDSD